MSKKKSVINHDKVSATISWGPLSTQLSFTGTLLFVPFLKRNNNKNTVLTQFH